MTLMSIIMIAIVALIVLAILPKTPKANSQSLSLPSFGPARSMRDMEVDEDLQLHNEAYRDFEYSARKKAAIAKTSALAETTTKAK